MKKLSMKVEDLEVVTFSVETAKDARRGTVRAHVGNSDLCLSIGCGFGTDSNCFETLGCTFTADFECMETAGCP